MPHDDTGSTVSAVFSEGTIFNKASSSPSLSTLLGQSYNHLFSQKEVEGRIDVEVTVSRLRLQYLERGGEVSCPWETTVPSPECLMLPNTPSLAPKSKVKFGLSRLGAGVPPPCTEDFPHCLDSTYKPVQQ